MKKKKINDEIRRKKKKRKKGKKVVIKKIIEEDYCLEREIKIGTEIKGEERNRGIYGISEEFQSTRQYVLFQMQLPYN